MTMKLVLAEAGGGGGEIADLTSASDVSASFDLFSPSSLTFNVSAKSDDANMIVPLAHDVKLYRDSELLGRFRILSADRSIEDPSRISYACSDYREMLNRKKLAASDTAVQTGYSGIDMEDVGWNLINTVQTRTGGSNGFNITQGGTDTGRTITGTRRFEAGQGVADAINSLTQTETTSSSDDPVEWDIVAMGDALVFQCWYPRRGRTAPSFIFDNRTNVISGSEGYATSEYANHITVQGNAGTNEVQQLNFGGPSGGTFTVTFRGSSTSAIAWNATLAAVQERLEALPSIGSGNVTLTGAATPSAGSMQLRFQNALAYTDLPAVTLNSSLTGGGGTSVSSVATGSRYTATVTTDDYDVSPYGRLEAYVFDENLTDSTAVTERANFMKSRYGAFTPKYTLDMPSALFEGPGQVWLGDCVTVDLSDTYYNAYRQDLRVSNISMSWDSHGSEDITVDVELPIPPDRTLSNLSTRVAAANRALAELQRQLNKARKDAVAGKTKTQKAITKAEQAKINLAQRRVDNFKRSVPGYNQ